MDRRRGRDQIRPAWRRHRNRASFAHVVIHALKIQRSHSGENSFTEWAGRAAAACLGSPGRFSPALRRMAVSTHGLRYSFTVILVRSTSRPSHALSVLLSIRLGFAHGPRILPCGSCIVLFVITAEINSDEPSAVTSCNNSAKFASHRSFLLRSQERHTTGALFRYQSTDIQIDRTKSG